MFANWRTEAHRWLDPLIAWRDSRRYRARLAALPDGEYQLPFDVPYVPQFASPGLIQQYIHADYNGTQDPNWQSFGADNPEDYAFWSHRVCALACLRTAIAAHETTDSLPTLWQLVQEGLAHNGYLIRDAAGNWKDEGWYVAAQVALARDYGLKMTGYSYASPESLCYHIHTDKLVAATVSPELGERQSQTRRYAGHLVVVFGFRVEKGNPTHFLIHNPSGRYPELQDNAWIPARRFRRMYAWRYATFEKL